MNGFLQFLRRAGLEVPIFPSKGCETQKDEVIVPSVICLRRSHLPVLTTRHAAILGEELSNCKSAESQVRLILREPLLLFWLSSSAEKLAAAAADGSPISKACLGHEFCEQLKSAADSAGPHYETLKEKLLALVPITQRTVAAVRNHFCYHKYKDGMERSPEDAVWSRYEQLKPLGKGHFGEVVLAQEKCSGINVAVKRFGRVPSCKAQEDEGAADCDEGHIHNALGHPNLIRVLEVVENFDSVFVVMEFAPGASLAKFASSTCRDTWIAGAAQQILSATAYCHQCTVLHGDLKPENVLCGGLRPDQCPICLVCDFGHAAICVGHSNPAASVGDPRYVAPEATMGEAISEKSDVFMLGMTFYELLSGGWLPFFNERADYLETSMPLYDSTRGWFMINRGDVLERMKHSLSVADIQRLQPVQLNHEKRAWAAPPEARELVTNMLAWKIADRPTALQALRTSWIADGAQLCKEARATTTAIEFGLWAPQRSDFAARLARRSETSLLGRLFLGAMGMCLGSEDLLQGRLLFRWMDRDGCGFLHESDFRHAAGLVDLDPDVAGKLFHAADFYNNGYVDSKNLISLLLDPESMSDEELLTLLRSVTNRGLGPRAIEDAPVTIEEFFSFFKYPAHRHRSNEMLQKACLDWQAQFIRPGETSISVEMLLRYVRTAL